MNDSVLLVHRLYMMIRLRYRSDKDSRWKLVFMRSIDNRYVRWVFQCFPLKISKKIFTNKPIEYLWRYLSVQSTKTTFAMQMLSVSRRRTRGTERERGRKGEIGKCFEKWLFISTYRSSCKQVKQLTKAILLLIWKCFNVSSRRIIGKKSEVWLASITLSNIWDQTGVFWIKRVKVSLRRRLFGASWLKWPIWKRKPVRRQENGYIVYGKKIVMASEPNFMPINKRLIWQPRSLTNEISATIQWHRSLRKYVNYSLTAQQFTCWRWDEMSRWKSLFAGAVVTYTSKSSTLNEWISRSQI